MRRSTALRWSVYVLIAILFAIACAYLSNWQFTRNAERSHQLELVAANYDASAVPLAELIPDGDVLSPGDEWHPVALTGEYLDDEQLLVRNRPHGGTAAFEVLVPFELEDGRVVIVDRGWVPPGREQADPDEVPAPPAGTVTVIARLKPGEPLPSSGRSAPEGQVPTIHLPLIADSLGASDRVETSAYGLMVSEEPAPATRPEPLESPSADPGPHLSYAIQWILFAVMGFIFIWYIIRSERRVRREDAEDAAAAAAAGIPVEASPSRAARTAAARRRDRDMEDEDALLDRAGR